MFAAVVLHGLAACSSDAAPAPPTDPPLEMATSGGCADSQFWAVDASDTIAVVASVDTSARPFDAPTRIDFSLPGPPVAVEVRRGRSLPQSLCNDVLDGHYRLDSRSPATEGVGVIEVSPRSRSTCFPPATGRLRLTGLEVDGLRFSPIDIRTDAIGCFPG
jgi:hypothetical protein